MQTSMVFNQVKWPGAGDTDDCWVVSAIQCINVTAPWLRIVSVPAFRKAAGDPDDGDRDGGTLAEITKGVTTLFPQYEGLLKTMRGWSWDGFVDTAVQHRPISVATVSSKLPTRLRFGFTGFHQITIAVKGDGTWLVANPLAPPYSRWIKVNPNELQPAISGYGKAKTGKAGVWAVAFPTDEQMAALWHAQDDTTPFDQEDIDLATAALRDRISEAVSVLEGVE